MAKNNGWCLALVAVAFSLAAPVAAQEAALEPLQSAFAGAHIPFQVFQPHSLMTPEQQAGESEAARMLEQEVPNLPSPDAGTINWLKQRVPNLDVANVRVISFEIGDKVMKMAADKKGTWMDVLSDAAFRGQTIYYASQDTLNKLDTKYYSGLLPVRGQTEGGQPFQMQGFLAGQGKVHLLYNWTEFTFKDEDKRFKIDNGGRLTATIRGAGDIGVEGFLTYGAPVFCPWARINRMAKESMYKVKVFTSCGDRGGNDLHPVRAR